MSKPSTTTGQIAKRKANRTSFKKGDPRASAAHYSHGLYSDQHPVAATILAEVERFMSAQYVDEGVQKVDVAARRGALIEYRGRMLHKNILKLALAIEERGLFDGHGKLRVTWISKLESLINTAVKIDNLLGPDRKPKDANLLDLDINDYIKASQAGKEDQQSETPDLTDRPAGRTGEQGD